MRPDSRREVVTRTFVNGREVSPHSREKSRKDSLYQNSAIRGSRRSYVNGGYIESKIDQKIEVLKHTLQSNTGIQQRSPLKPVCQSSIRNKENKANIDEYTYF